jgi:hypothetical protein
MSPRPANAVGIRHRDQADTVGQTNLPQPRPPRRRRAGAQPLPPFRVRRRSMRHPFAVQLWDGRVVYQQPAPAPQVIARLAQRKARRAQRAVEGTRRERIASLRRDHPAATKSQLAAMDRQRRRGRNRVITGYLATVRRVT